MIVSRAPLRISLTGGGTDFEDFFKKNNGAVISFSFNKYVSVILKENYENNFLLSYSKKEKVLNINNIKHSIIRESLKYFEKITKKKQFFEIHSIGDIPGKGTGLGSSSAFSVAILNSLGAYYSINQNKKVLAKTACEIEIKKCKYRIGLQDQYASSFGGFNFIHFSKNSIVKVEKFKNIGFIKDEVIDNMYLVPTGIFRKSSSVLNKKFALNDTIEKEDILKKMYDLTCQLKENIITCNFKNIAKNLNDNWYLKKKLSQKISNKKINNLYNYGISSGAIAGKLLGAGNGGFLLFLVEKKNQNKFFSNFKNIKVIKIKLDEFGACLEKLNDD